MDLSPTECQLRSADPSLRYAAFRMTNRVQESITVCTQLLFLSTAPVALSQWVARTLITRCLLPWQSVQYFLASLPAGVASSKLLRPASRIGIVILGILNVLPGVARHARRIDPFLRVHDLGRGDVRLVRAVAERLAVAALAADPPDLVPAAPALPRRSRDGTPCRRDSPRTTPPASCWGPERPSPRSHLAGLSRDVRSSEGLLCSTKSARRLSEMSLSPATVLKCIVLFPAPWRRHQHRSCGSDMLARRMHRSDSILTAHRKGIVTRTPSSSATGNGGTGWPRPGPWPARAPGPRPGSTRGFP